MSDQIRLKLYVAEVGYVMLHQKRRFYYIAKVVQNNTIFCTNTEPLEILALLLRKPDESTLGKVSGERDILRMNDLA